MSGARGDILILFGGEAPDDPMAWACTDAFGAILTRGDAGEALPANRPTRTVLVMPGADAQVKRLELPARTEAQARVAAPYLFEGAVAAKEPTHYAFGDTKDASGLRLVAAISETRLARWLARCRELAAEPQAIWLDFTIWPTQPGEIEIHEGDTRTIIAGGKLGGFSIEPSMAPSLFARWLALLGGAATRINLSGGDAERWRGQIGPMGDALRVRGDVDAMQELARGAANPPDDAPQLRQGAFAPESRKAPPWRLWRFAALLAVLALLLQVGALVAAGWRDQNAAAQILAAAQQDFQAAYPGAAPSDFRAAVRARINALDQARTHPVLSVTDPLVRTLQRQPLVRLDELRHEGPGSAVRLRISAAQPDALAVFSAELQGLGLQVDSRDIAPVFGRYSAELTVQSP